jgi:hypothetical protein
LGTTKTTGQGSPSSEGLTFARQEDPHIQFRKQTMIYEAKNEKLGVSAVVTEDGPESYTVSMRSDNGSVLPYQLEGLRLEQAKARADRWAARGGPMR